MKRMYLPDPNNHVTLFEENNFSVLSEMKDENLDVKVTAFFCSMEFS